MTPVQPPRSAWQLLERSLTRLVRMRELDAPADVLEREVALARKWWSKLPLTPKGGRLVWPEGLLAVAQELGFDPNTRGAGPVDPQIAAGVADAFALYDLVVVITRAIEAAGGVEDLSVTAAGPTVHVCGIVSDVATRDRIGQVAASAAPQAFLQTSSSFAPCPEPAVRVRFRGDKPVSGSVASRS